MKHRSPLVTLAAVVLAFIIMFIVNMLSGPPGSSSTGTASPAPTTAAATSASPQLTETEPATLSATASETAEDSEFPEKVVYAGRTDDGPAGWIVLEDGSQVGVQTTGADSSAAPQLDPENPQVMVDGESLDAAVVNGDEDL